MTIERQKTIQGFLSFSQNLMSQKDAKPATIIIPAGTCGQASGANAIIRVAKKELLASGLADKINLRITGCHGYCELEPSILIEPEGVFYPKVKIDDVTRIVKAAASGKTVKDILYRDPASGKTYKKQSDIPFFANQRRAIMSRNEKIDPIRIYNYIEFGGYRALGKVLEELTPADVISEIKSSGLRGRGGAGFPTGLKWEFLSKQNSQGGKFLVCNADEGDPGAYMDRCVLEGNPHSIIEGMIIGAYATGADRGVIYVRNEYPLAIKHLLIALRQAREMGFLGENILDSGLCFDIDIVRGAGAFVCGEETALIKSIDGFMGEPRQRPPFPIQKGIGNKPTAINNVETWANIPIIMEQGAEKYAQTGTAKNAGTKIFSLVGKINNTGLAEVPLGTKIRDVVEKIGGGAGGRKIKAVQTGGPSGGCIPADKFDLPIEYESLAAVGSIMGSGGMIVMDESTCMVDVAKYFMKFLKDESCGRCFTCRKGTQRMYEILEDITEGRGRMEHLDLLDELANVVRDTSMCGLGQSAPNPILSTLKYFRHEYEKHILEKRCDAFVCSKLVGAPCQLACPLGTEAWRYIAKIEKGDLEGAYAAIRETNPFPSVCARVCDHPCESRCRLGTTGSRPVAIRALKRYVTDNVKPSSYRPKYDKNDANSRKEVAIVGAGPAGLTAAHYLSLKNYKVTVFEANDEPGGMLFSGVPEYRLPRRVLKSEIDNLLDKNITLQCGVFFGKDITLDKLFKKGYGAVFLALGAHRSRKLDIPNERAKGVFSSMDFLRAHNHKGKKLAKGRVAIIGGGNSAIDAARVALRQKGVAEVTIYYRRSRNEMPAFPEEIEASLIEGIKIVTLVSPSKIKVRNGRVSEIEFIRNELGPPDSSGRFGFKALKNTEHTVKADTVIAAIGEQMYPISLEGSQGVVIGKSGMFIVDEKTLSFQRPGVFAGGDAVTGPNSAVNAIAAGKKAAVMIDRFLHSRDLREPIPARLPEHYIEHSGLSDDELDKLRRMEPPTIPLEKRKSSFEEVEMCFEKTDAVAEARRCMRCDIEFTMPKTQKAPEPGKEKGADI